MSSHKDRVGVWMIYDYGDGGPYVSMLFPDVVPAAKHAAKQAYGRVGFWPFEMALNEAIDWWEEKKKQDGNNKPDDEKLHACLCYWVTQEAFHEAPNCPIHGHTVTEQ